MAQSFFYRMFPPPDFLRMPISGIDISDESVHVAELENTSNGRIVKKYHKQFLPKGLVESGRIKDASRLKKIFTQIRKDYKLQFVNVSLPEQHGYVVVMHVPTMKLNEIYGSIELQLEDQVPILAKDAVLAYDIIQNNKPQKPEEKETFMELNVSVYPKDIIYEYINIFKETGLTPLRFEIEAHAVARSIVPKGDKGTFMVLDFGKTRTGITIVSREAVQFTSTINLGGDTLTKAIARVYSIEFKEAEKLKKEKGFLVGDGDQKILLALMPTISALTSEISKHYQYWDMHNDSFGRKRPKIESLLLCGGLANLTGFPDYLSSNLHTDVRVANVFENINSFENYIPDISFKNSLQYATSIGLALSSNR